MTALRLLAALVACAALLPAQALADYAPPGGGEVRIDRDAFGVPHVVAADDRALYFGAGWAQAEDDLTQLLLNYRRAAGRAAEVLGPEAHPQDRLLRALDLRGRAVRGWLEIDAEVRDHLVAFTEGVSAYMGAHPDGVPAWAEPVAPADAVALSLYVDLLFVLRTVQRELGAAPGARRLVGAPPPLSAHAGSNQCAVAPARAAAGGAMLSIDPHLPFAGVTRWTEIHLVGPGSNVMGATIPGLPYVTMGRTADVAWSMTVNAPDIADVYAFAVDPDDASRYRSVDGWKTFAQREVVVRVRSDGVIGEHPLRLRDTDVGPVLAEGDGVVYAAALPWAESLASLRTALELARARNVAGVRAALALRGLSMFNVVAADRGGSIYYVSNQRQPVRDADLDPSRPLPGDEPAARWRGLVPFADLPQVRDPAAGFLLNTNSGPFSVCPEPGLDPSAYPATMVGHDANDRARRLTALLAGDADVTFAELQAYATDTYLLAADRWLPAALPQFAAAAAAAEDDEEADLLRRCHAVLERWDRRTDPGSAGAVLFAQLGEDRAVARALRGDDAAAFGAAVLVVARRIERQLGAVDAPWGSFSRIRRNGVEAGCAGHAGAAGIALRPTSGRSDADGVRHASRGSSYAMVVDFASGAAVSCLPFGQSSDPASPHHTDQLPLYARGAYKPAWFAPDDVAANLGATRTLEPPPRVRSDVPAALLGSFRCRLVLPHGPVEGVLHVVAEPARGRGVVSCSVRSAQGDAFGRGLLHADGARLELTLEFFPRTLQAVLSLDPGGGVWLAAQTMLGSVSAPLSRVRSNERLPLAQRHRPLEVVDLGAERPRTVDRRGLPAAVEAAVDEALRAWMDRNLAVGLSVAVARKGEVVDLRSYGHADWGARVPASARTRYRWASISKPLTAVAALQLAQDGRLDLDGGVRGYVPEFKDHGVPITSRQLLAHLGGIPHYRRAVPVQRSYDVPHPMGDRIHALDVFNASKLVAPPGTRYHYSTHGYALLGAVLQRAGGQRYRDLVAEQIAVPLGLDSLVPDHDWDGVPHRAAGYHRTQTGLVVRSPREPVSWKLPGGGWISTVEDLAAFGAGFLADELLPTAVREAMCTPQRAAAGAEVPYGLGFGFAGVDGERLPSHGGSQNGTATYLLLDPGRQLVVAVMCNTYRADARRAALQVYRLLR